MPLKIIGAGFGRTGTTSTYSALNQLGFPCYHIVEMFKANAHLDFWHKVADAPPDVQHDWERVFANYTAAVDAPACCVWRELLAIYPEAKVLLTLHPKGAEAWYESVIDTIYRTESMWQFRFVGHFVPSVRKFVHILRTLVWDRLHQGTVPDRAKAIAHYNAHVADVTANVSPERLLVFSADQGWEPLCTFLGVPAPAMPFPSVNERAVMKRRMRLVVLAAYVIIAVGVIAIAAAIYGLTRIAL